MTPTIGLHHPALDMLNELAFKAPVVGVGTIRGEPDTPQAGVTSAAPFGFENDMKPIGPSTNIGLEFQWAQNDRHVFIMGGSTWEGDTRGNTRGQLPVQGKFQNTEYERRAKISYTEYYLGWRYNFRFKESKKYRLYSRITLNELFDIDYKEEHVFSITGGVLDDVKRIVTANGQATGVLMFQFGLGGEYFLNKQMSIGMEAGYIISPRSFQFDTTSSNDDFQLGDSFSIFMPVRPLNVNSPLGVIDPDTDAAQDWTKVTVPSPQNINLRFDGWKLALRFTIYY